MAMPPAAAADSAEPSEPSAPPDAQKGGVTELIVGLDGGLSQLVDLISKAQGVDPKAVQMVSTALDAFRQGVQTLLGKNAPEASPQGAVPADQGASPPEVAGAKGAVQAY